MLPYCHVGKLWVILVEFTSCFAPIIFFIPTMNHYCHSGYIYACIIHIYIMQYSIKVHDSMLCGQIWQTGTKKTPFSRIRSSVIFKQKQNNFCCAYVLGVGHLPFQICDESTAPSQRYMPSNLSCIVSIFFFFEFFYPLKKNYNNLRMLSLII